MTFFKMHLSKPKHTFRIGHVHSCRLGEQFIFTHSTLTSQIHCTIHCLSCFAFAFLICSVQTAAEWKKNKITEEVLVATFTVFCLFLVRLTWLMLQLQLNPCQLDGDNRTQINKGSADMKESTFSPLFIFLYSLFVEQNEKSLSLKCCCESVFSSLKQV